MLHAQQVLSIRNKEVAVLCCNDKKGAGNSITPMLRIVHQYIKSVYCQPAVGLSCVCA